MSEVLSHNTTPFREANLLGGTMTATEQIAVALTNESDCGCRYLPSDEVGTLYVEPCDNHDPLSVEAGLGR